MSCHSSARQGRASPCHGAGCAPRCRRVQTPLQTTSKRRKSGSWGGGTPTPPRSPWPCWCHAPHRCSLPWTRSSPRSAACWGPWPWDRPGQWGTRGGTAGAAQPARLCGGSSHPSTSAGERGEPEPPAPGQGPVALGQEAPVAFCFSHGPPCPSQPGQGGSRATIQTGGTISCHPAINPQQEVRGRSERGGPLGASASEGWPQVGDCAPLLCPEGKQEKAWRSSCRGSPWRCSSPCPSWGGLGRAGAGPLGPGRASPPLLTLKRLIQHNRDTPQQLGAVLPCPVTPTTPSIHPEPVHFYGPGHRQKGSRAALEASTLPSTSRSSADEMSRAATGAVLRTHRGVAKTPAGKRSPWSPQASAQRSPLRTPVPSPEPWRGAHAWVPHGGCVAAAPRDPQGHWGCCKAHSRAADGEFHPLTAAVPPEGTTSTEGDPQPLQPVLAAAPRCPCHQARVLVPPAPSPGHCSLGDRTGRVGSGALGRLCCPSVANMLVKKSKFIPLSNSSVKLVRKSHSRGLTQYPWLY